MYQADDLILVSVDDHVVEPPDVFTGRLPAALQPRAPRVVRTEEGDDSWWFEGELIPNIGLNAVAGRPPEDFGIDPTSFDEIRDGCYDIHSRVRDMNAGGVLASLCFPSFPQFCGQLFARCKDRELASAVLRAYNQWTLETWCGTYPGRMIPLGIVPLWDPLLMAREVLWLADRGCFAVSFSENPHALGWPSLYSDHWDPFWAACDETETVVCLHIGSSSKLPMTSPDAAVDASITMTPLNTMEAANDLVWSPVLRRFKNLRFALSEGGIGWVPYFLERIDAVYDKHRAWTGQDFDGRLPSELFLEHVAVCFIKDRYGLRNRDLLRLDAILWEQDFPHSDSSWPQGPEVICSVLNELGMSAEEVAAITHENALRLFKFDAFGYVDRSAATVGSLRSRARDVDVRTHPSSRRRLRSEALTVSSMRTLGSTADA